MSLHVDFIYQDEQRDASLINPVFVVRMIVILIPLVALFFGSMAWLQSRNLRHELKGDEAEFAALQPRQKAAQQLQTDLTRIREIEREVNGWRNARFNWPETLEAIRDVVSENMQLTQLQADETLELAGNVPIRQIRVRLRGRARGETPDETAAVVQTLRSHLLEHDYLASVVSNAVIPRAAFMADTAPGADRRQFVFQLNVQLNPRRFE